MEFLYFMGAAVIFLVIKRVYDVQKDREKILNALKYDFGKLNFDDADDIIPDKLDRFLEYKVKEEGLFRIDLITNNDISLNSLYNLFNTNRSAAGEEYFYYLMNAPVFDENELKEREKLITLFSEDVDARVKVGEAIYKLKKNQKISLFNCIDLFESVNVGSSVYHVISDILLVAAIVFAFFSPLYGVAAIIIVLISNIASYFRFKGKVDNYMYAMGKAYGLLKCSKKILSCNIPALAEFQEEVKKASDAVAPLAKSQFSSKSAVSDDLMAILLDYINMITHLDIIMFNSALKCAVKHRKELFTLYEFIGRLDSMITIAGIRKYYEVWCTPEFSSDKKLSFKTLYHPEIPEPVPANLETDSSILITGSNASGKSTFLKSVAINQIFAQTIHTCFAEEFKTTFFRVYSSMALSDDLIAGESYYITEIKALKRIIDAAKTADHPVLCFIDEVLRGTNTVERIASSTSALKKLSGLHTICFAATHDIELTFMLEKCFKNYHFEENLDENNNISFDYLIKEGPSKTRNAIVLLKAHDYDSDIIENARNLADDFMKSGKWNVPEA